jgi:hypothetical protein
MAIAVLKHYEDCISLNILLLKHDAVRRWELERIAVTILPLSWLGAPFSSSIDSIATEFAVAVMIATQFK